MIQKVETLVVGAGVVGSSVAMHLAQKGMKNIRVIDVDLDGSLSSSELNAGGVRATWVQPINIQMSKVTIDYFAQIANEVGYRDCGYLWLHPQERLSAALQARERQVQMGWPVDVWDVAELKRHIPFIDKTDGIAVALFAPRDGLINPNLMKTHFREKAKALGVVFDDRTWLQEVQYPENASYKVQAFAERFETVMSHETKLEIVSSESQNLGRIRVEYQAERVINCAGAWAFRVAQILGYQTPCYPVRRQVCVFDCRDVNLAPYGMIVDTSGVYFHPEATNGLSGFATPHEPKGINYQYDGESFFTEHIWPALYERSSHFERLKHLTGWAGLYDVSPDECAILGNVNYGGLKSNQNVYEAHSFSGHGVMHSYSAGLALAEQIIHGRYETFDVEFLSGSRFERGELVHENLII
jgi:sarcosine oxidase subunit beta